MEVIAAAATLLALLIVTTATGAPDDLGRPGRILLLRCSAVLQQGAGPWPGSFYSVPRPAWWTPAGWVLLALLPPLAALMGWCAVSLLTPARAMPGTVPAR